MAKEKRVDFIIGAKDESKAVVARTRENIKREMKQIEAETSKLRLTGGGSIADRQGLVGMRDANATGERAAQAARLRALRTESRGISDDENILRREMNAQAAAAQRKAIADRARERLGLGPEGGGIKGLKGMLGEESALGNVAKMARGAGAVAGFALVGQIMRDATGQARELAKQLNAGEISAGEMVEKIAGGLPVIGGFWQTGRNIRELFTQEEASIEAIYRTEKLRNQVMDSRVRSMEKVKDLEAQIAEIAQKRRDAAAIAGTNPGSFARERLESQLQQRNDRRQLERDIADKRKAIMEDPTRLAQIDQIQKESRRPDITADAARALATSAKDLVRQRNEELAALDREAAARRQALAEQQAREAAELEKTIGEAVSESRRESQRKLIEVDRDAYEEQLKQQGKFLEAKLARIEQGYSDEIEAAQEARRKQIAAGYGPAAEINYQEALRAAQARRATGRSAAEAEARNNPAAPGKPGNAVVDIPWANARNSARSAFVPAGFASMGGGNGNLFGPGGENIMMMPAGQRLSRQGAAVNSQLTMMQNAGADKKADKIVDAIKQFREQFEKFADKVNVIR